MDHDMKWFIFQGPHPDQFVRMPSADFCIPDHLLQLFVKELIALVPGDPGSDVRKKNCISSLKYNSMPSFQGLS
jgi:hypothetical protein